MNHVHLEMYQIKEEFMAFLEWLKPMKPRRVLEIGSHHGGTAVHFCTLAQDLVVSVDLPDGAGGGMPLANCLERDELIAKNFPHFRSVLGDSHAHKTLERVQALAAGELFDVLFVDGDHTYDGVKQDCEMYTDLVKPCGFVAMHDINDTEFHREQGCDVHRFWTELQCDKVEFNVHGKWGGIGVVQV